MLLVGSHALNHHTCGGGRTPLDTDYITTHDEAKQFIASTTFPQVYPNEKGSTLICRGSGQPVELMIAWPGSSTEDILNVEGEGVASLNTLYLLKMSHRYLRNSPHFEKTRRDILLMRALGAVIEYPLILKKREAETYDYKHPSLMRNKKAFFNPNEGVRYVYDHDTIHLAMAVDGLPAYTRFKKDQAEVTVDKKLWDDLPLDIKLNSVLEESYVLALERSQIPYRGKVSPGQSFRIALQKVCTSISSGWWREFAWENYDQVLGRMDPEYLGRFDRAVADGIVKPFDGQVRHDG